MKKYELLLILPGTLDTKEAETRAQEILALVSENSQGAEISAIGKNRLAYPIKQIRYGYFYTVLFNAEPVGLKIVQDKLALLRDILRAMVTHFNIQMMPGQKIAYSAEEGLPPALERAGKTERVESLEEKLHHIFPVAAAPTMPTAAPAKVDLADINKKLDEILSGENIIPGV